MNFLQTVLAFVVCLGSLIVFHELGHYLVARWCGVKVLRFSVGMGKVVWSRRFGPDQTEWAISALPLGGYVKMLDAREGELAGLPEADLQREFTRQNVWKRIAIVAAGPAANFLIAIVLFAGLFMHGIEEPSSKISVRAAGSAAAQAGLQSGDVITAVNEQPVQVWSELRWQFIQSAIDKHDIRIAAERPGAGRVSATVPASALAGLDLEDDVPSQLGVGVSRPAPVVQQVMPGSPAERAGLREGDLLTTVDGTPVADGIAFIDIIRASAGKTVQVALLRAGQPLVLDAAPQAEQAKSGKGTVTVGKIGAYVALQPDMINVPSSPIAALGKAVAKVWDTCAMTLKMIGKMITGEASLKNVTGPITIADYAGQTARMGVASYLSFIAFISISLGVMNLLPIPVLDGGHLLYYSLEVLTGRSVPERVGEIAQRLGMGLLLTLMLLAVFNDVARLL
ncbi:regulator of sigma E protease [Duganella sp. CF402]|uniref:RIP metalloprotease RseP n=1 Tax=unclassified Duganella TaxID=2636909 RepID=UPI0008CCAA49|nr:MULTISPECIES: RIP metalloprotease RseP [unclassified Duganella]RZT10138.1 regulator of sigma E protease [Duganella sp. BK701]SEL26572.1 regulator of sigma E protease [Duganella sp. CF402]